MSGPTFLDWSGSNGSPRATVGDLKPCVHCRRPALLRHPVSKLPCHKMCEEAAIDAEAEQHGTAS